ncbi:hypothetical protein Q5752_001180 [Cryptotrichosporon argae]
MTTASTYQSLTSLSDATQRLQALKDLKNTVIGNTWKKVDVAHDSDVLDYLLALLSPDDFYDVTQVELVGEAATILGTLASGGALTVKPLVAARTPAHLVRVVHAFSAAQGRQSGAKLPGAVAVLAPVLRALRNVLSQTADLLWGHMRGVGVEQRVVGTGLVGDIGAVPTQRGVDSLAKLHGDGQSCEPTGERGKGKGHSYWKTDAADALELVFEPDNLAALLRVMQQTTDPRVLVPLYHMLARLALLPRHRTALLVWRPTTAATSTWAPIPPSSFLLDKLAVSLQTMRAPKMLEAVLELFAVLVQDPIASAAQGDKVVRVLEDLVVNASVGVRIAAAGCLTSVLRAESQRASVSTKLQILRTVQQLFADASGEDKIKLCFVLSSLVADDAALQCNAAEEALPTTLLDYLSELAAALPSSPSSPTPSPVQLNADLSARSLEAVLLALASLAFQHERTRVLISEHPGTLSTVRSALSHTSYGVRAAAAQLVRALSRTVALLRTSLVDAGVADALVALLRAEAAADPSTRDALGQRARTVEIAATAALCNLVTDFSPLKATLISDGGVAMLVGLVDGDVPALALNAAWALKNLVYHSPETLKMDVLRELGADKLRALLAPTGPHGGSLRPQALELLQNLVADVTPPELMRVVDALGDDLVPLLAAAAASPDADLAVPALAAVANLALGTDALRTALAAHTPLMDAVSAALAAPNTALVLGAIRVVRMLVENPTRRRPRQAMADLLAPYEYRRRVRDIASTARRTDIVHAALVLSELLDRAH